MVSATRKAKNVKGNIIAEREECIELSTANIFDDSNGIA